MTLFLLSGSDREKPEGARDYALMLVMLRLSLRVSEVCSLRPHPFGSTYRQVQMMLKHKDPKTVMRYDHGQENMEQNAVNFLGYDEV